MPSIFFDGDGAVMFSNEYPARHKAAATNGNHRNARGALRPAMQIHAGVAEAPPYGLIEGGFRRL